MCLVWTLKLNETYVSKLKDASLDMWLTPVCWNQKFYFVYFGPWISGAEWLESSQNLNTLCLLNLPELDDQDWFVFNCPDVHCLASVTYLNEVGRGLKLAFWEHQIHWCTFIGSEQESYWFLQLGEMFEPSGRWFPEIAGIISDLLGSKDFNDTSSKVWIMELGLVPL